MFIRHDAILVSMKKEQGEQDWQCCIHHLDMMIAEVGNLPHKVWLHCIYMKFWTILYLLVCSTLVNECNHAF